MKKMLSLMCCAMLLVPMLGTTKASAASEEINLSVEQIPDVDVTLSLGKTTIDGTNFGEDLKERLKEKGLKSNLITIQALETQEINVQDSFNWLYYGHDISDGWAPQGGKRISSSNGGKDLFFDGYSHYGYADFLYLKNTNSGKKTFSLKVDENKINYHSMEGAGFLFNTDLDQAKGTIKGWAIILGQTQTRLYKINTTINNFYNSSTSGLSGKATLVTTFTKLNVKQHDIKIEVDANSINMWDNGQNVINNYQLNQDFGVYGFGPIASHSSHACSIRSQFSVNDLTMTATNVKKFSEVIRMPDWKNQSERFVVNLSDTIDSSFDSPQLSGEILTRLINERIDYIGVGTDVNKAQSEKLIAGNNGNGIFLQSKVAYDTLIEDIAEYIVQKVIKKQEITEEYVIVGSPLSFNVNPQELKTNTQNAQFPKGRWMVEHDPSFYDNSMGKYLKSGIYQPNLDFILDKPGKYEIWFGDSHPKPRFIYAHRKPVAKYSLGVKNLGSQYEVSINDSSYDPDLESQDDKGIKEYKWQWKETTSNVWTEGKIPNKIPTGKDYVVQLSVKDYQNAWSDPVSRYITTDSASQSQPVADFDMPATGFIHDTINITNNSYDPGGKTISAQEWTLTKAGTTIYTGANPPTTFKSYGVGDYSLSLKVKNSSGIWSESFVRFIKISADEIAPTIIVDKESKEWTNQDINIEARFNDTGGSGFDAQRYAITNSKTSPSSGWSAWDASLLRNVSIDSEGIYYLHLEAKDKQGNLSKETFGPYKIDKTAPTLNLTTNDDNREHFEDLLVNLEISDNLSGVFLITMPDGSTIPNSSTKAQYVVKKNGKYYFTAIDNAGNVARKLIDAGNIRKELELTIPTIEENLNVTIQQAMNLETQVGTLNLADWRDGENNWRLKLEATQLTSGSSMMKKGTIELKGINSVVKARGTKTGSLNYKSDSMILDDGIVEIMSGHNERGEYNADFKANALKFNLSAKNAKKGAYNTQLKWTLESAPEIN